MLTNYHTHTRFSDGKGEPEEFVLQALKLGFDALGFSEHEWHLSVQHRVVNEFFCDVRRV